jgi:hypothetical protein
MPGTLRQLWAEEDAARDRELADKRRATRPRAKRGRRLRGQSAPPSRWSATARAIG